jgi:DNA-binding IclR family transcriptional regulator
MEDKIEKGGGDDAFLSSVDRALRVLQDLAGSERRTLSEIARALGVNKNIAFRLVHTLERLGFIYEDQTHGGYRLTYKLLNMARTQWLSSDVLSQALPVLRALAAESGELVRLAIVERGVLSWIYAETGSWRILRIDPAYTGDIIPHVHAASKARMMTLDDAALARVIEGMSFPALTPNTITSPETFKAHIEAARAMGYAVNYEERDIGVVAMAAPVLTQAEGERRQCVGVVSISTPASRLPRSDVDSVARRLLLPATEKLSGQWPLHA